MKTRDIFDLILLAALWGSSFLFMRISVPEFGAVPMMAVRVALAGLFLMPLIIVKNRQKEITQNIIPISIVGIIGSAIPFSLIAYSTLYVTAGFASVLNATTPMFAVIIGYFWLKQRITQISLIGLLVGVAGVVLLVWDKISFTQSNAGLAIIAGLSGAAGYGFSANYTKNHLVGIHPLAITTGSLIAAAIFLLPFAFYLWPQQQPSATAWINVFILAIACTALAQTLFFRLLKRTSTANTTSVTFLIPVFGLLWGNVFLDEIVHSQMLLSCTIILLGTGMTIGLIKLPILTKKRT